MATTQHPTPPDVGKNAPVRVTRDMHDDLTILMSTGATLTDVIRAAVRQAADIHRTAWANGVCPTGTAPIVAAYSLHAQPGYTPPADPQDAPGHPITPPPYPAAGPAVTAGQAVAP
jgi:hypothetical protein